MKFMAWLVVSTLGSGIGGALIMRLETTGPGVQHEGFDVDEKISLFDFAGFSL